MVALPGCGVRKELEAPNLILSVAFGELCMSVFLDLSEAATEDVGEEELYAGAFGIGEYVTPPSTAIQEDGKDPVLQIVIHFYHYLY